MLVRISLGLAIGAVVSLMFWRGNQTPHLVSTFPDGMTLLVLLVLLVLAVRFDQGRHVAHDPKTLLRAGLAMAAATGVVLGSAVALLATQRLTNPSGVLLAFGFLTALGSSLVCGVVATLVSSRWRSRRAA